MDANSRASLYSYRLVRFRIGVVAACITTLAGGVALLLDVQRPWAILAFSLGLAAGCTSLAGLELNATAAYAPLTPGGRRTPAAARKAFIGAFLASLLGASLEFGYARAAVQGLVLLAAAAISLTAAIVIARPREARATTSTEGRSLVSKGEFGRPHLAVVFGLLVLSVGIASAGGLIGKGRFGAASVPLGIFWAAFGLLIIILAVRQLRRR